MVGVPYINAARFWWAKVIWSFLLLVALGFMCLHLWYTFDQYYSWPKTTKFELGFDTLKFPEVTICNTNVMHKGRLDKFNGAEELKQLIVALQPANLVPDQFDPNYDPTAQNNNQNNSQGSSSTSVQTTKTTPPGQQTTQTPLPSHTTTKTTSPGQQTSPGNQGGGSTPASVGNSSSLLSPPEFLLYLCLFHIAHPMYLLYCRLYLYRETYCCYIKHHHYDFI
jgi:hypothetical protein